MTVSQGSQTIQRLCRLAGVSRASYYRFWRKSAPRAQDTAMGDAIQRVALANSRRRGYRYITHQLRRDGIVVNHKRVLRLMRQDNLLCLRRKPFVPQTTDTRHDWEIVPNLVRGLRLSGLDQLWVADITYIRLQEEFVWRSSSMPSAGASSAGRWLTICGPAWRSTPSPWPWRSAGPPGAA